MDINWLALIIALMIAIGSFTLGVIFGVEWQKVRVQRAWRANNRKLAEARERARESLRDYHRAANDGAEDR